MPVIVSSPTAAPSTGTDALVTCVRNKFDDWTMEDYLTAAFTTGGATFTVSDGTLFAVGEEWEFADGTREVIQVRVVSSNTITPKFGHRGSPTSVDHALGAVLRRKPRFTDDEINTALEASADGLWPTVYGVTTDTIVPVTTGQTNFVAPADAERIIFATQASTNSNTTKKYDYLSYMVEGQYDPQSDAAAGTRIYLATGRPLTQYSTGKTWHLPDGFSNQTYNLQITYAYKVSPSTAESGLMSDAVCWGAVAELAGYSAVRRSRPGTKQDEPSVGGSLQGGSNAERKYELAKMRLAGDLRKRYPIARRWRG